MCAAACVDAPAGFARPGSRQRETERCCARCYPTESEEAFAAAMRRFAGARNDTPLRQRYYWKLVGRVALAHLAGGPRSGAPRRRALSALARRSAEASAAPRAGSVEVREGFPSETFARSNGTAGVLAPEPRAILASLAAAPWRGTGNDAGRTSSVPPATWLSALSRQRAALLRDLARAGPLPSMLKIPEDPPWADLWDAFACAFSACCGTHRCGALVGVDASLLASEGAIVAPLTAR